MRVLLIGGAGQLGAELRAALAGHDVVAPGHDELDVTRLADVMGAAGGTSFDAVINAAAFHDVPKCEADPATSFAVNATGPFHLARACAATGAKLVHVGTDYVFDGAKGAPYSEADEARPLMVYGASKLAGEHLALAACPRTYVVRTTGLFGRNPCRAKPGGRNFVENVLAWSKERDELRIVGDQLCCPTYAPDLARQIVRLLEGGAVPGVYHAVTPSGCSWHDFARLILDLAGARVKITAVTSDAFPAPFRRPADSRLANARLERAALGVMRPLREALEEYLGAVRTR
jgi:dTDP-4-dehydrorhamnose reductase